MFPNIFPFSKEDGFVFDSDFITFETETGCAFTSGERTIYNQLFIDLKASTVWAKLIRLWIPACPCQDAAVVSLVNPSSTYLTEMNGVDLEWTANLGYRGGGGTKYLDTNFNPVTESWSATDAAWGTCCHNWTSSNVAVTIGLLNSSNAGIWLRHKQLSGNQTRVRNFTSTFTNQAIAGTGDGFYSVNRGGGISNDMYFNGAFFKTTSVASTLPNGNIALMAQNKVGTGLAGFMNNAAYLNVAFLAESMTAAEHSDLSDALKDFFDSIGTISPIV